MSEDALPVLYNNIGSTGYFQTPSAQMADDGTVGLGGASVNPYFYLNFFVQFFPFLELTGNYRIHRGQPDPVLGKYGFGDIADRTLNAKLLLWSGRRTGTPTPEIAIGAIDVAGRRSFRSGFVVATMPLSRWNLEVSAGYGKGRLSGPFGGISWMPFRGWGRPPLEGISLAVEYDPIDYRSAKREPHPEGRCVKSRINYGVKYRLLHYWDLSFSRQRGSVFAGSLAVHLPLGDRRAMRCKTKDPLPPRLCLSPDATEPDSALLEALQSDLRAQGLRLNRAYQTCNAACERRLLLDISNCCFIDEGELRCRLQLTLAKHASSAFGEFLVTITALGLPTQSYCFRTSSLRRYASGKTNAYELMVQSPMTTPCAPWPPRIKPDFVQPPDYLVLYPAPFVQFFFGSCRGKFQYALGANLFAYNSITNNLSLTTRLAYVFLSSADHLGDVDRLYPSQMVNVRTDSIRYFQERHFLVQSLFLQQNFYLKRALYGRCAVGYFEAAYGGVAAEVLYYPTNSLFAIGAEGALLWKRSYSGLGFQGKLRRLDGWKKEFVPYSHLSQGFLELYFDVRPVRLVVQASVGQFLAGDKGASFRVTRYYPSGLELYLWYTITTARDYVHGDRYRDCGLGFEVPLDFFLARRSKRRWGRAMSAWLRDSGARADTGYHLYRTIYLERNCMP